MFNRILIVCVGNICRSPTAECLLKNKINSPNVSISSAGIKACVGQDIDNDASAVLQEHGFIFTHIARQLTIEHIHQSDVILVMEKKHIDYVLQLAPEARGRVFLLGKWQSDREILDPYKQSHNAFLHTYTLIDEAVTAWTKKLGGSK